MSRWSAEPLLVALAPGEMALARGARQLVLPAAQEPAALLAALDDALDDTAWHAARAEVVLSQRFVRHLITPPPGKALAPAEERALVLAGLREIYGEAAENWCVRVTSQPPHAGLVGAAIEGAFAAALDALLARRGFRRIAIRPLASVALRRAPKKLDGWWALVEPGWLTLFGGAQGCWRHVAALPVDAGWLDALPELVAREQSGTAVPIPASAWLQTAGLGAVAAPRDSSLRWQMLPGATRATGAQAFLELCT